MDTDRKETAAPLRKNKDWVFGLGGLSRRRIHLHGMQLAIRTQEHGEEAIDR